MRGGISSFPLEGAREARGGEMGRGAMGRVGAYPHSPSVKSLSALISLPLTPTDVVGTLKLRGELEGASVVKGARGIEGAREARGGEGSEGARGASPIVFL